MQSAVRVLVSDSVRVMVEHAGCCEYARHGVSFEANLPGNVPEHLECWCRGGSRLRLRELRTPANAPIVPVAAIFGSHRNGCLMNLEFGFCGSARDDGWNRRLVCPRTDHVDLRLRSKCHHDVGRMQASGVALRR